MLLLNSTQTRVYPPRRDFDAVIAAANERKRLAAMNTAPAPAPAPAARRPAAAKPAQPAKALNPWETPLARARIAEAKRERAARPAPTPAPRPSSVAPAPPVQPTPLSNRPEDVAAFEWKTNAAGCRAKFFDEKTFTSYRIAELNGQVGVTLSRASIDQANAAKVEKLLTACSAKEQAHAEWKANKDNCRKTFLDEQTYLAAREWELSRS